MPRCAGRRRSDRGAVTVELALAMPVLFAVLGLALWAVSAAGLAMDCTDAARAGARAAARGDGEATVRALVARTGPRSAVLSVEHRGGLVTVTVRVRTSAPGPFPLPAFTVGGSAVAEVEE
ncbi:MAG TPA: TadE family type IV pilus minor pilin [Sporichthya sp.]|nr:TadE family type IV pilus minor pilin [Sporichthya sp.]